jgi:hypothetical protein
LSLSVKEKFINTSGDESEVETITYNHDSSLKTISRPKSRIRKFSQDFSTSDDDLKKRVGVDFISLDKIGKILEGFM